MLQTLFHIPLQLGGYPVFGFGLLLAVWVVFGAVLLARLVRRQGFNADTLSYLPLLALVAAAIIWLLPAISDAEGLPIRGYGVMLLLGIIAATGLLAWRVRRVGLDPEMAVSILFWLFVPGIIGARAFYVIQFWHEFQKPSAEQTLWAVLNVAQGGLVVFGSVIGGLLGIVAFARRYRLPLLALGDLIAPTFALGLAFGRMGCMLNGCCFGAVCDLPWSVTFPWGSPAHVHQVEAGQVFVHGLKLTPGLSAPPVIAEVQPGSPAEKAGLKPGMRIAYAGGRPVQTAEDARLMLLSIHEPGRAVSVLTSPGDTPHHWIVSGSPGRSLAVHPSQLYSTINALLLCLLLLAFDPFHRRDGEVFALGLTLYAITRFLLEMVRSDELPVFGTGLTISQNISVATLAGAIVLWIYVLRRAPGLALEK